MKTGEERTERGEHLSAVCRRFIWKRRCSLVLLVSSRSIGWSNIKVARSLTPLTYVHIYIYTSNKTSAPGRTDVQSLVYQALGVLLHRMHDARS